MSDHATSTYSVPEISCAHCKSTIEGAVRDLDGVEAVDVDIDAKSVTVEGGDQDVVIAAIEDAGYDVER